MAIFLLVYMYDVIHFNEQQYYLMIYYKKNKHFLIINGEQFDVLSKTQKKQLVNKFSKNYLQVLWYVSMKKYFL